MRITKTEGIIITLLNIIIVALVAVIVFLPRIFPSGEEAPEAPPADAPVDEPTEPEHNRLREAADGLVPEIAREIRLMGLGDESVVAAYSAGGVTYIFGNATVAGLDFDTYGGFLCTATAERITSFSYFGGNITAACKLGSGFCVAAGGKLYSVNADGEAAIVASAPENGSGKRAEVVGLYPSSGGVDVVSQPSSTSLMFTEYAASSGGWTAGRSTRIDSGYTLKFYDLYDFGEYRVIAARAHSLPRYDSLAFYTFTPGGDAAEKYYGGSSENLVRPYAVMPCPSGYFALVQKNGVATVISVDYGFTDYHSYSLGFAFTDARLFYSDKKYYACFDRTDGAVTYEIEATLSRRRVGELDGVRLDAVCGVPQTFAGSISERVGSGKNGVALFVSRPSLSPLSLDISGAAVRAAFEGADGLTLVLSASGGAAVSAPTAGTDIYIITLK